MLLERALTDVAFDLILKLSAKKRPREVVLRRAVSSAYYAVFHAFCRLCADELVGAKASVDDRNAVYRSIDHRNLRTIQSAVLKQGRFGADVVSIMAAAVALQDKRALADYDLNAQKFGGKAAVLSIVQIAESTVEALQALPPASRKALAVALIARGRT